jgi:NAD(P)-dependent dehydrogenase (short-subunit alcohol dehydrogenase family)
MVQTTLWLEAAKQLARDRKISLDEAIEGQSAKIPMGDLTQVEDVAAAVSFLASDDARHITGSKIVVDGGLFGCGILSGRYAAPTRD